MISGGSRHTASVGGFLILQAMQIYYGLIAPFSGRSCAEMGVMDQMRVVSDSELSPCAHA